MEMGKSPRGARTGAFNIGFLIFISGVERNGECDLLIFFFFCFVEEGSGYVKLEELLAEETWLEVLHGELQKPYAKRLCEFVEKEIKDSGVDIFPPQHLIFNALNTTPFDRVKAVIIGQVRANYLSFSFLLFASEKEA